MSVQVEENKIIFTRNFKATAEQIFKAYTEPNLFKEWFHPQGASTEIYEFDVQTGGKAFFAIRAPQGTSYTVTQYNKVIEPKVIDYNDYFADKDGSIDKKMAGMHNTIHIETCEDDTSKVTSVAELPDPKAAQQLIDMGVEAGMNSTFDNLELLLEKL
ncbi:SRPBCC family protein [Staphylococcus edaphicus]|uniref:Glutathione S-transferase n=1 Tax=Staphylococcus edaphicus TaxID=1955013 RepID=A0A2C6WN81_9STAP|nr:SRPBCC domain-containing protein [Staphylococcus edaphicus]PHK49593.1 glutathione S-transferase [Staphylococcus edaphicus]UQW82025.1 SRPBCC domain-containing protein [Staphylococcus edaphicus]